MRCQDYLDESTQASQLSIEHNFSIFPRVVFPVSLISAMRDMALDRK